jgi:hypothetical protein
VKATYHVEHHARQTYRCACNAPSSPHPPRLP